MLTYMLNYDDIKLEAMNCGRFEICDDTNASRFPFSLLEPVCSRNKLSISIEKSHSSASQKISMSDNEFVTLIPREVRTRFLVCDLHEFNIYGERRRNFSPL